MKKLLTFLTVCTVAMGTQAQNLTATQRYFGGALGERIDRITKYSESEFIIVGRTDDPGSNPSSANMFALRTDVNLSSFQMARIGTENRELAYAGVGFADGTFGVVGHTSNNGATSNRDDGVFIRFDETGNVLNQKFWGDNADATEVELFDAVSDDEDNVVVVGRTAYPGITEKGLVKKMTSTGFELWSIEIEVPNGVRLHRVQIAEDGYFITGYMRQNDNSFNTLLCKVGFDGNMLWSRVYDISGVNTTATTGGNNSARSIVDTGDGLIIVYRYRNSGASESHSALLKVDYTGSIVWRKKLQFGTGQNWVGAITKGHGDKEYVLVGETNSPMGPGSWDATMYSISDLPNGPVVNWMRVFTGSEEQRFFDIESFDYQGEKGYILVGDIHIPNNGQDGWIVRTDQFGGGWANQECWLDNLPASLVELPMTVADAGATASSWNILSDHDLTFDQPLVVPLNNDGLCQPMAFVSSVESVNDFGDDMVLFPNPSNGEVFIRSEKYAGQQVEVEIVSVSGQIVLRQSGHVLGAQIPLRLNHCPAGMYFVRIHSVDGSQSQHKLILQ